MLTQEMHLEIDLMLQKLNTQVNKDIREQEKDWFLNNEVIKYINQRVSPTANVHQTGFQDTVKRLEDLRGLVKTENRPILTNSRGGKYVVLPSDYFQYVRLDSLAFMDCPATNPLPTTETYNSTMVDLKLPTTVPTIYKITIVTSTGPKVVFDITDLPTNYLIAGDLVSQRFGLIKAIKIKMKEAIKSLFNSNTYVYWGQLADDPSLSSFRLESTEDVTSVTVEVDGVITTTAVSELTRQRYLESSTPLVSNMRVIDAEFSMDARTSHLSGSRAKSMIAELEGNSIKVIQAKGVVVGSVDITYICQPNIIDLHLNSNLNMSTKSIKEITSATVKFLKALIQDSGYQAFAKEHILVE